MFPKFVPNYPKPIPNGLKTISKHVPKKCRKSPGRARNRTGYHPDPTPGPVRGPAHWANLVTEKRVSGDFLCIKTRDAGVHFYFIFRQKRHPQDFSVRKIRDFFLFGAGSIDPPPVEQNPKEFPNRWRGKLNIWILHGKKSP